MVARQIHALGHEVVVANPGELYGNRRRKKRNDRFDAEFLARQGRADVKLVHPIQHRGTEAQQHLAVIRGRDQLVRARTKLINHVRGAVKSHGARIGRASSDSFHRAAAVQMPQELSEALQPLLEVIADLTTRIRAFDKRIEKIVLTKYPEAVPVQQPKGVGALTALAFVLLLEDPKRFRRSRDVGAFFGLVPRLDDSRDSSP